MTSSSSSSISNGGPAGIAVCEPACDPRRFTLIGGDICCGKCGRVDEEATAEYLSSIPQDYEAATTVLDHQPESPLLRIQLGSQHDRVSEGNKGICWKLWDTWHTKDFEKNKIPLPIVQNPEVVDQLVGKGMRAVMVPAMDVKGVCGHNIKNVKCKYCKKKVEAVSITRRFSMPSAFKNYRDDLMYIRVNTVMNQISARLQMDPLQRAYYGKEADKAYSQWITITEKLFAHRVYLKMAIDLPGVNIKVNREIYKEYLANMEKTRKWLSGFLDELEAEIEAQELALKATTATTTITTREQAKAKVVVRSQVRTAAPATKPIS